MSILVTCPSCRTRFQVSDKFAGQTGPCPKCKSPIQIPKEEVKVHAPTEFGEGGRTAEGKLATKPIARAVVKVQPVAVVAGVASVLVVLVATFGLGRAQLWQNNFILRAIGLLIVSPPLVIAGYSVVRDDELEPYRGKQLYLRASICALAYVLLWGMYGYVADRALTGELWTWIYVAPPFLILGAIGGLAALDLDFGSGFFLYSFYVLVTVILRWVAGMDWLWNTTPTIT